MPNKYFNKQVTNSRKAMKHGGKAIKKGMHKMPNGKMMKNSDMGKK